MNRRETIKLLGGAAVAAAASFGSRLAFAAEPSMVVVVKIAGIPWFNALEKGVTKGGGEFKLDASMVGPANVDPAQQVKLLEDLIAKKVNVIGLVPLDVKVTALKIAGIPWFNALEKGIKKGAKDFNIDASMVGPANVDPAQQVKLLEDLIAKKVNVIGLVPLDVKVREPVLKRAQAAGIKVITHEGPEQEGRDWNVELIDSVQFGEVQMQRLAKDMGEEGDYVVYVGTLTTPLHNKWADAAIAYQKEHYPKMKLVADRFPGADEIDTSYKTTLDVIKAYPNLKGILGFGSNGPIGAGNALREKRLGKKIVLVGTVLPSQAKDLIADGIIREGFLWNPTDAGYAMVAVGAPCSGRQGDRRTASRYPVWARRPSMCPAS